MASDSAGSGDRFTSFLEQTVDEIKDGLQDFDADLQKLLKHERQDKDRKTAKEAIRKERERRRERIEELATGATVTELRDALQAESFSTQELAQLLKREEQNKDRKTAKEAIAHQLPQSHPARRKQLQTPDTPSKPAEPKKPSEPEEPQQLAAAPKAEKSRSRRIINGKRRWVPALTVLIILIAGVLFVAANGSLTGLFTGENNEADAPSEQDTQNIAEEPNKTPHAAISRTPSHPTADSEVVFSVTARDPDGVVENVVLLVDGSQVGTCAETGAQVQCVIEAGSFTGGEHEFLVEVTDDKGAQSQLTGSFTVSS